MDPLSIIGGVAGLFGKAIDKIWPDPTEAAKAKALIAQAEQAGRLNELNAQLSAILAEANSSDPWTSRARPSFMYVMYAFILMALPMGVVYTIRPEVASDVASGVQAWLAAIPSEMWTLFGIGYLGYTGGRTFEKVKGVAK